LINLLVVSPLALQVFLAAARNHHSAVLSPEAGEHTDLAAEQWDQDFTREHHSPDAKWDGTGFSNLRAL
jgi:hypothetical protein